MTAETEKSSAQAANPALPPPAPMLQITIDDEFKNLLPSLSPNELAALEADIRDHDCLDSLKVWPQDGKYILLDGHNRYALCQKLNDLHFSTVKIELNSRKDAFNWIIDNQLHRRNITSEQAAYLRGKQYNLEKLSPGGDRKSSGKNCHLKTAEKLAHKYGVSERTIRKDGKFAKAVDNITDACGSELKMDILSGQSELTKKEIIAIEKNSKDEILAKVQEKKQQKKLGRQPNSAKKGLKKGLAQLQKEPEPKAPADFKNPDEIPIEDLKSLADLCLKILQNHSNNQSEMVFTLITELRRYFIKPGPTGDSQKV